jgi:hypothetical protein
MAKLKTKKAKIETVAYSIKQGQILKLKGSRYVPVTKEEEVIALNSISNQIKSKIETNQQNAKVAEEVSKEISKSTLEAGYLTSNAIHNYQLTEQVKYLLTEVANKISKKIEGINIAEPLNMATDEVDSTNLYSIIHKTRHVNEVIKENLLLLDKFVSENI